MNVLWLTPDKPNDISVGRQRIADRLEQRGFSVTVRGTTARTAFRSFRERGAYDVVVGTTRAGALVGATIRMANGPPMVVDHVDPIRQFKETHPRWLATVVEFGEVLAFRLSAVTLYVYEEERLRVERHAPRAMKTDLGVAFDRFADPGDDVVERARARLAEWNLRENVIVYIGGLEPMYNVGALLDSVELLDDWSLVVAGAGELEPTVRRAHDGESVVFLGTVPHEDIPGYLAVADVGACLVGDPHTLKVLEYAAAGLPVVQLDGRARDRFGDRATYCDTTPDAIARAVEAAASTDPTPLQEFAARFDYDVIADTYERAIRRATS